MQTMPDFPSIPCPARLLRPIHAAAILLLAAATGCGPGGPIYWDLSPRVTRPDPGVVVFLVDGLPPRHVEQGCAEGWLPNIKTRFHDTGLRVENAVAALPCITYGSINTILTGVEPAEHGIIGNRWFDPEQALFRDYATIPTYRLVNTDSDWPTLYERIAPEPSASIQAAHHRGVTYNVANWAVSGTMWFFERYTAVDRLTASSTTTVGRWASFHKQWPTVVTYYMPGADSVGHRYGADSPEFRRAITHVDYQIGRVCDWLDAQGILETSYIVLLSDHGHVPVHDDGFVDLLPLVRDAWGRNVTDEMRQDGSLRRRQTFYDRFDTVLNHQDGRRVSIHFKSDRGWPTAPAPQEVEQILTAPDEADRLWNVPGVQCVAYLENEHTAVVRNRAGLARIREIPGPDEPRYVYEVESADVLGYRTRHAPLPSTTLRTDISPLRPGRDIALHCPRTDIAPPGATPKRSEAQPSAAQVCRLDPALPVAARPVPGAHLRSASLRSAALKCGTPPARTPPALGYGTRDTPPPLTDREWLHLTADATYPDVVSRLIPLLRHRRAGQVVAFPEPGYSFVPERGGHGGLHRHGARMTWLMAGPGLEPGTRVFAARGVDVLPTLLWMLNMPEQAADLPGHPLAEVVGSARAPVASTTAP